MLDQAGLDRALTRIAHEIVEQAGGADLALVGIKNRGETLAERIAEKIAGIESKRPAVGALDITLYRDDLGSRAEQPRVRSTEIPFSLKGITVVLVDDVLFTGRASSAWPSSWTGGTASCPSVPTTSARTCPRAARNPWPSCSASTTARTAS